MNLVYNFQAFARKLKIVFSINKNKTNKIRIFLIFIKWHNIYKNILNISLFLENDDVSNF